MDGHPELSNIAPSARSILIDEHERPRKITSLDSLGQLRSICATLIINGAAERIYALRSVHDKGSMDWIISLQKKPETITNIAFLPTKRSGAAAVLPPFIPGGSQTLSPPTDFGCLDLSVPQKADDLAEACKRWPAMCEN